MSYPETNETYSRQEDVIPEEVLLHVSLAFMVMLGFLLTKEMVARTSIARGLALIDQGLMNIPENTRELVRETDLAREDEQMIRLLMAWVELQAKHNLFQCVSQFDPDEANSRSLLARLEPGTLIKDVRFQDLLEEIVRLFRPEEGRADPKDMLADEIAKYTVRSIQKAGYKLSEMDAGVPEWVKRTPNWDKMADLIRHGRVGERIATKKNVQFLVETIHKDFMEQRRKVADIQYTLLPKIAKTNRSSPDGTVKTDTKFKQVLDEWFPEFDERLKLLPEVKSFLRAQQ